MEEFLIEARVVARHSGHSQKDAEDRLADALLDWDYVRSVEIGATEYTDPEKDEPYGTGEL